MSEQWLKDRELSVSVIKISAPKHALQITVTVILFSDFSTYLMGNTQFK